MYNVLSLSLSLSLTPPITQVGVTVHTPGDPDKAVRIATAAALAESARKLAQEAASFIDEEVNHF